MKMQKERIQMKERIIEMLMSTGRTGMEGLINYMEENGFLKAHVRVQIILPVKVVWLNTA